MRPINILFSIALCAACGVQPTASPTTFQDYEIARNQADCEVRFRCCASSCAQGIDLTFNKGLITTQKLIDAGKVTFDANAGKACLDSYRARNMDCELTANNQPSLSPMCNQVLVGKLALGQACDPTITNPCVAGTYCDQSGINPVCANYVADGAACGGLMGGGRCATTSYCDNTSMTCKPTPKSGQACTASSVCDSSSTKLVCLPSMVCGPPIADGAACTSSAQCLSGTCGTMQKTCQPSPVPPSTLRDSLCR